LGYDSVGTGKKNLTGTFAKLQKSTISSVTSVRPHGTTRYHGRIFIKFNKLRFFQNGFIIQVLLTYKSDKE